MNAGEPRAGRAEAPCTGADQPCGKVLFVDDEPNVLDGFRANLRKRFAVTTALGPQEGLRAVREQGPFAVVVTDLKMPGMDGIAFLSQVKELSPDATRIMLTGFADVETAMGAVNRGQVFRFLTKPCPVEILAGALEAGMEQHRLLTAERELLHGTLKGTIRVLSEALGLANPEAFGRSQRVKGLVSRLARVVEVKSPLELELAALLSHLGCMGLPPGIIAKINSGVRLNEKEQALYAGHPRVGSMLIKHIPRLGSVAAIIEAQLDDCAPETPQGARILRLAMDYDAMESRGLSPFEIFNRLRSAKNAYDQELMAALEKVVFREGGYALRRLSVRQMTPGMILDEPVLTRDGMLLLAKGAELDESTVLRLAEAARSFELVEPVRVLSPV